MPELPEVELAARGLRRELQGRALAGVEIVDPKLLARGEPSLWQATLPGRRLETVERRAKYLLLRLSGGWTVVAHLRMTGRFVFEPYLAPPLAHPYRIALRVDEGRHALFRDTRRFGRFWLAREDEVEALPELAVLGPDALLEPRAPEQLAALFHGRRQSIKALLMDQRRIGGLGNICAIEVLYQAGISPARPAGQVTQEETARLAQIIPEYLRWAIDRQSRRELLYLGEPGAENVFTLYRRAGEPCPRCGAPIRRTRLAGRGTYFCEGCQS